MNASNNVEPRWRDSPLFSWAIPTLRNLDYAHHGDNRSKACQGNNNGTQSCSCRINSHHASTQIYIDPPDPLLLPTSERAPVTFHRKRLYTWYPEVFYSQRFKHMPCVNCGPIAGGVIMKGWNPSVSNNTLYNYKTNLKQGPRLVMSIWGDFYLLCKMYHCKNCKIDFLGYDERLYNYWPKIVLLQMPAYVRKKSAIDRKAIPLVVRQVIKKQSFRDISAMWSEMRYFSFQ